MDTSSRQQMCLGGAAGAALAALGSLLPWVTARTLFGQVSVAGTEGDGQITLALGIAVAVLFLTGRNGTNRSGLVIGTILAGAALATAGYNYSNITDRVGDTDGSIGAAVGIGLYLTLAGTVVAFIAGILAARAPAEPATPPVQMADGPQPTNPQET